MRLEPHLAKDLVPFQSCCLRTLDSCEFASSHAGMSEDGTLAWVFHGPILEVMNTNTGQRVASLCMSQIMQDPKASLMCVKEYRFQGRIWLLLACNRTVQKGLICLLNVGTSVVVKTIEIPQKVTSVEPVLAEGGKGVPCWAICEQLQQFYGVVAVGTEGGYVYLVDMRIDDPIPICQTWLCAPPLTLDVLSARTREVRLIRQQCASSGQHLALQIGMEEETHFDGYFHFRRPDLKVVQSFKEGEVQVTCLKYIPQIGTLAVGYNFGGFQLWRLRAPALEYSSSVQANDLPVSYFAYQEPENDPRNFAYLWAGRDDRFSEQKQESLCTVCLYQMCYAQKSFYANYGNFYEELRSVVLGMEHVLTSDPYNSRNTTTWSSQLLAAYTISDHSYHPPAITSISDSFEDGSFVQDMSLCVFVWEAQDSRPGSSADIFLSIFDLNRWYHAQMPSRIKCVSIGGQELCPFFAVYRLTEFVQRDECGTLLNVQVKPGSLLRFTYNSSMPPEQHFYPSSLAFDTLCIFSNSFVTLSFLGIQRQVLADLEASGPVALLQPADMYHYCVQAGLLPRTTDNLPSASLEECQRKAILTMALEHDRVRFIVSCVRSWADGEFIHQGCTLQFLLVWTWERVMALKHQIDLTSQPLYDWSGTPVDQRMLQVLESSASSLAHLRSILRIMLTQSLPVTEQGAEELKNRIEVVSLLLEHQNVVLWFIHNSLLPEYDEAGRPLPSHYTYPASELTQVFRDRRMELRQLDSAIESHRVILIDALVHNAGEAVSHLWQSEGGTGQYPPPSLRVALSTYLLNSVSKNIKHAIVLYLLFDLAAVAHGNQEQLAEKIPQFAKAFDVPLGLVQQVHGFWLIDHKNAEEGLKQLLGMRAREELGLWQHICVLQALMCQGKTATASTYLTVRNPPILTIDDVKMRLTIMVANRQVWEALVLVRSTCGVNDIQEMLSHVFQDCRKWKLMEDLFRLPLPYTEEQCLQNFLAEDVDPTSAELLIVYLLQRAQYVPAIRLNDRLRHKMTMDFSVKARQRAKTRNVILEGFRHALPEAQQYLIKKPTTLPTGPAIQRIEVHRPKPLSTAVTKTLERRVNCQSALILAVIDKVAEAKTATESRKGSMQAAARDVERQIPADLDLMEEETLRQLDEAIDNNNQAIDNPGPFLCTPQSTWTKSRLGLTGNVVYPSIKSVAPPCALFPSMSSPASPTVIPQVSFNRSKVFTADCMTLLQTPKIEHRTMTRPEFSLQQTATPQSILKVSRLPANTSVVRDLKSPPKGSQRKKLGFSGAIVNRLSASSTPSSISPASTPSPTSAAPPELYASRAEKMEKTFTPVTPKQLRFAEPEVREISPLSVSPDGLARRPLRSPPEDAAQNKMVSAEDIRVDEEVTFNFSRQMAEPMEDSSECSTLSLPSPASGPESKHDPHPVADKSETMDEVEEGDIRQQERNTGSSEHSGSSISMEINHFHEESTDMVNIAWAPAQSAVSQASTENLSAEDVAEEDSQEEGRVSVTVPEVGSASPGQEEDAVGRTISGWWKKVSPQLGTSSQLHPSQSEVFSQDQISEVSAEEGKSAVHISQHDREEFEVVISRRGHTNREGVKTKLIVKTPFSEEALPEIECEVGPERLVPGYGETPHSENFRPEMECKVGLERAVPKGGKQEVERLCEIASECDEGRAVGVEGEGEGQYTKIMDAVDALDVQPWTPIKLSPQMRTPEQPVVSGARTSSASSLRMRPRISFARMSAMPILEKEDTHPSPPKRPKVSGEREEMDEMPPLLMQASAYDNSNENRSATPPPSPTCRLAQEEATPQRARRASKSSSLQEDTTLRIQTESPGDQLLVNPPLSPSRRSTRRTTPVRSLSQTESMTVSRSADEHVTENLESDVETTGDKLVPNPPSPSRRSTRRSTLVKSLPQTEGATVSRTAHGQVKESLEGDVESGGDELVLQHPVSPSRRSTRRSAPVWHLSQTESATVSGTAGKPETVEPLDLGSDAPHLEEAGKEKLMPESSSRVLRRRSKTPELRAVSIEPVSPARQLSRRSKTPELTHVVFKPSPSRRQGQSEGQSEDAGPKVPEALEVGSPSRRFTRSMLAREHASSADSIESVPVSQAHPEARSLKTQDVTVSEMPLSSPPTTPTRRSLRSRSKTPELSPGRQTTRIKKKDTGTDLSAHELAVVTEQIRSSRKQKKEELPKETMEITQFEFAPPTPVPAVWRGDKTLEAALDVPSAGTGSELVTFAFAAPITRSSAKDIDQLFQVVHPAVVSGTPEDSLPEEPPMQQPKTSAKSSALKKGNKSQISEKRTKTSMVPAASPSDSPIMLLSPGTDGQAKPGTDARQQPSAVSGRGRSTKKAVLARLRKRRQVDLW